MTTPVDGRSAALRGIAWMVAAALGYSLNAGIVKQLSGELDTMAIVFWRSVVAVGFLTPFFVRHLRGGLTASRRLPLFALRGLLTYLGMVTTYFALANMPIADVYALQFTLPLFTILCAVLILGERAGLGTWLACAIGFAGTLIVLRPGLNAISIAAIAALASAVFYALSNVTIKILSRSESPAMITFFGNLFILLLSFVPTLFNWTWPGLSLVPWIIALGVVTTLGQWALAQAIAATDARVVWPFDFLRLPFTVVVGYVMFAELPGVWTWLGAVIIFGAAYYVIRQEAAAKEGAS